MGFLDFIAGVAEVAMQGQKSSLNRIERKYGARMTDAQRAKWIGSVLDTINWMRGANRENRRAGKSRYRLRTSPGFIQVTDII